MSALVIVDLQNDFLPGGTLAVPGGDEAAKLVNQMLLDHYAADSNSQWDLIVATRDWHPAKHCGFKEQGGQWPVHCVKDTPGAEFSSKLVFGNEFEDHVSVISKGTNETVDSYSAFYDTPERKTELDEILKSFQIDEIFVCGLATDYCVKATVLAALDLRIPTTVIIDACRAVNVDPLDEVRALVDMLRVGAQLTVSENVYR